MATRYGRHPGRAGQTARRLLPAAGIRGGHQRLGVSHRPGGRQLLVPLLLDVQDRDVVDVEHSVVAGCLQRGDDRPHVHVAVVQEGLQVLAARRDRTDHIAEVDVEDALASRSGRCRPARPRLTRSECRRSRSCRCSGSGTRRTAGRTPRSCSARAGRRGTPGSAGRCRAGRGGPPPPPPPAAPLRRRGGSRPRSVPVPPSPSGASITRSASAKLMPGRP